MRQKFSSPIPQNLLYYPRMRCAIIADIHANLEAFTAVLGEIEHQGGVDEVWSLGDIVGYGPDPVPCIELLRRYNHVSVAGNHDRAAIGKLELSFFNPLAAEACRWTAARLGKEHVRYLENLPLTADRGDFLLVHGSPRRINEYLAKDRDPRTYERLAADLRGEHEPHSADCPPGDSLGPKDGTHCLSRLSFPHRPSGISSGGPECGEGRSGVWHRA